MATREDVYRRFGEVSEVAQLLETELGTVLVMRKCIDEGLLMSPNGSRATTIYDYVNRQTLGRLLQNLGKTETWVRELEQVFNDARSSRNELAHAFYLKHNLRINSEAGRKIMLNDLAEIDAKLSKAWWIALLLGHGEIENVIVAEGKGTGFHERLQEALEAPYLPIRT